MVPAQVTLREMILNWLHGSIHAGHSGRDVMVQRVKSLFYWKGMAKDIQAYIRACTICQQCKYDTTASPGLLQPLPIPEGVWMDISMDFIDGLPLSCGHPVILVVVDRLSKAAHFIPLKHPYTAALVAQAILNAYQDGMISVPIYARISGAESEKSKKMLSNSNAKLYDTVEEAISSLVQYKELSN